MKSWQKFLYTFCLCLPSFVQAEVQEVVLNRTVDLEFEPKEAFFLLANAGTVEKIPVQVSILNTAKKTFASGVSIDVLGKLEQAFLVLGKKGEMQFFPFREQPITVDVEVLKEELEKLTENLESWKVQVRVQSESLERLRNDAAIIGNLGRIAEKATELERVRVQIKHLEKDIVNLKHFIALAGTAPQPRNFARRQITLTEQLGEIAKAAKLMEASERGRKAKSETELQQELHLVEMTRDDDYDALRLSLKNLRQTRSELEDAYMRK